jgi:NAD(P)-dependent dehydrogenase (short-subunit alcohol dehydrogenase family)
LSALGRRSLTVLGDITRREEIERVRDAAIERFGAIDILVNNAGDCVHRPALVVTDDQWRQVMDINLDAVWMSDHGPSAIDGRRPEAQIDPDA